MVQLIKSHLEEIENLKNILERDDFFQSLFAIDYLDDKAILACFFLIKCLYEIENF